jgi:hypothetical protein
LHFYNLKVKYYLYLPLGYDFPGKPKQSDDPHEKEKRDIGNHTSQLLEYALKRSGSGPKDGIMHLTKKDIPGTRAFLRATKPFCSPTCYLDFNNMMTVEKLLHPDITPQTAAKNPLPSDSLFFEKKVEKDKEFDICKVQMNSLMIFLHIDQGQIFNEQQGSTYWYTPYASPTTNSRSMNMEHVDKVVLEVEVGNDVVSQEDFVIAPYQVRILQKDEEPSANDMPYRCTLDRDNDSPHLLFAKRAQPLSRTTLQTLSDKVGKIHKGLLFKTGNTFVLTVSAHSLHYYMSVTGC